MTDNTQRERGLQYMIFLAIMSGGLFAIDQLTNLMIPITVRHFTGNTFLIALIIALNRLFGFLVQPWIAWKSDHVQTRFGRRRPFFLLGIPVEFISLVALGLLPFIFTGDVRTSLIAVTTLFIANFLLQFFQDFNMGAQEPLYADTFKQKMLGRASAIRAFVTQILIFIFIYGGMKLSERNEFYPYGFCAVFLVSSFLIALLVVREDPAQQAVVSNEMYNPLKHLGMLRNPDYAKVALIGALGLIIPAAFWLFTPLFVTRTLGLSKTALATASVWTPVVAFVLSLPIGWLADRFGPRPVMSVGFFAMAAVSAATAFLVHDYRTLFIVMLVNAGITVVLTVPMSPMVFQYAAPSERGTIFGLIQFVRGSAAFVVSLILGQAVAMFPSYDTTVIYAEDIGKPKEISARLLTPKTSIDTYLSQSIPPRLLEGVRAAKDDDKKEALAKALNSVLESESFYKEETFAKIELSGQSRKLKGAVKDKKQQIILNRSLLQDILGKKNSPKGVEQLMPKANYRISYMLNILISLLGGFVVLSTKKGRNVE